MNISYNSEATSI